MGGDSHQRLSNGQTQIHTHLDEIDVAVADISDKTIQELQGTLAGNARKVTVKTYCPLQPTTTPHSAHRSHGCYLC